MASRELVFVYNADAGLGHALLDAAHKLLSPGTYSCDLCALTYGAVRMRAPWAAFVQRLPAPVRFMYRDQVRRTWPHVAFELPALLELRDGAPRLLVSAEAIRGCADLHSLMRLVERSVSPV